jgi:hypothetical protein
MWPQTLTFSNGYKYLRKALMAFSYVGAQILKNVQTQ